MRGSNLKIVVFAALIFLAVTIYTYLLMNSSSLHFEWVTGICMISSLLFYTWKLVRRYPNWYAAYMFDKNVVGLRKKVEKPRLFFYSIFLPVMVICIYIILKAPSTGNLLNDILLNSLFITLYIIGLVFLDLTWKNDFESRFIPFAREIVAKRGYEFKSLINDDSLGSIFDSLIRCGFLEYLDDAIRRNDRQKFILVFKNGYYPELPLFKMKMDNIQTHYFFDCLKENISGLDLRGYLKIFFHDRRNKQPTEESIRASKSKATNEPKRKDELDLIFNKLVKISDK